MHPLANEENAQFGALLSGRCRARLVEKGSDTMSASRGSPHVPEPVAVEGRLFEFERLGGLLHSLVELPLEDVCLS